MKLLTIGFPLLYLIQLPGLVFRRVLSVLKENHLRLKLPR